MNPASGERLEARQTWSDLLFLHWSMEPERVRPAVPPELPLDLRDGKAWVGVVAFMVEGARPPGLPAPLGIDFLETNARTYVRRPGGDPGVWFFSLDAESSLAVAWTRLLYGLPYFRARMSRERRGDWVEYRTTRRSTSAPGLNVCYRTGNPVGTAGAGSMEEFLIERYVLHNVRPTGLTTVRVDHPPYALREVEVDLRSETLLAAADVTRPETTPLVHFADRVDVRILRATSDRVSRGTV